MRSAERDARIKLLLLQGMIYRAEIVEAKITLCETSRSFARVGQLLGLIGFRLEPRVVALIGAAIPRLMGRKPSGQVLRRLTLIVGSCVIAWWLIRRRVQV